MKILFSPSESKSAFSSQITLNRDCFIFPDLYKKRLEIINLYDKFLQEASEDELCKAFGLKNLESDSSLRTKITQKGCIKAMLRYSGVAYEHLNYRQLDATSQNWIDENVLIFSNLFGVLRASDLIPEYKLKQGEKFTRLNLEKFYKEHFSNALDNFLENDDVLDLRAGYYEKFYEIKKEFLTFKFVKNKKIVSHFAKAYRGKVLQELAKNKIRTKDELMELNFENLHLVDMKKIGLKSELLFEIGAKFA